MLGTCTETAAYSTLVSKQQAGGCVKSTGRSGERDLAALSVSTLWKSPSIAGLVFGDYVGLPVKSQRLDVPLNKYFGGFSGD